MPGAVGYETLLAGDIWIFHLLVCRRKVYWAVGDLMSVSAVWANLWYNISAFVRVASRVVCRVSCLGCCQCRPLSGSSAVFVACFDAPVMLYMSHIRKLTFVCVVVSYVGFGHIY